jgi:transposase
MLEDSEESMLSIPGNARIFLYQDPISMRKSFEGLSAAIEKIFPEELTIGSYFVFLNRKKDHMKVLYWDADGFAIWYKRLEKGSFSCKGSEKIMINRREFFMMLEGITPKRLQPRYNIM